MSSGPDSDIVPIEIRLCPTNRCKFLDIWYCDDNSRTVPFQISQRIHMNLTFNDLRTRSFWL